jgi:hypothetical protein
VNFAKQRVLHYFESAIVVLMNGDKALTNTPSLELVRTPTSSPSPRINRVFELSRVKAVREDKLVSEFRYFWSFNSHD